jgi:hypothetical protein
MGCPLCNRKTAGLLIAGLVMLFLPGILSYVGMGLIALAYGMALLPGKTCSVDYTKNEGSGRIDINPDRKLEEYQASIEDHEREV